MVSDRPHPREGSIHDITHPVCASRVSANLDRADYTIPVGSRKPGGEHTLAHAGFSAVSVVHERIRRRTLATSPANIIPATRYP